MNEQSERWVVTARYHHGRWWPHISTGILELKYTGGQSRRRMKALRNGVEIAIREVFDHAEHATIEVDARPTKVEE